MSLRNQITLRIVFVFFCTLFLGGGLAIWQAQESIEEEVSSSVNLALQLVKLSVSTVPDSKKRQIDWVHRLQGLQQTRHLNIFLEEPGGNVISISGSDKTQQLDDAPPDWFINMVGVDYAEVRHQIITRNGKAFTLIIKANPLDELSEVWQETNTYFLTLCMLFFLSSLGVHLVFNRTLKAINIIVQVLQQIEKGEYRQKLPEFSTQEYDNIAKAINHMTDVLEETREQNRQLTQHSLKVQEEERQRLSQELHDELGQSLTGIKVLASAAAHEDADTVQITQSISEICDYLMRVVRSMMQQLHPLMLTDLGLKATLEDLMDHWRTRNPELSIDLQCDDMFGVPQNTAIQLFRVVQECLTNINRHAQANRARIVLQFDNVHQQLRLTVIDDGVGCVPNDLPRGFGLLGMKARVKSLEGDFAVQSTPGSGMQIDVKVPMSSATDAVLFQQ